MITPNRASIEYKYGRSAYARGDSTAACPYPAPADFCPKRYNWFSGYWEARYADKGPPGKPAATKAIDHYIQAKAKEP